MVMFEMNSVRNTTPMSVDLRPRGAARDTSANNVGQ